MSKDYPTVAIDPIPGFPGYFANRLGVIFSTKRSNSKRTHAIPLCARSDSDGYHFVQLCREGKVYQRKVHQLILETYVGPKPDGLETRHMNDIRNDNRLSNLVWGTRPENDQDKVRAGSCKGTRNAAAKLTEDDVKAIRSMTTFEAAMKYRIHRDTARRIIRRETWAHVQ